MKRIDEVLGATHICEPVADNRNLWLPTHLASPFLAEQYTDRLKDDLYIEPEAPILRIV